MTVSTTDSTTNGVHQKLSYRCISLLIYIFFLRLIGICYFFCFIAQIFLLLSFILFLRASDRQRRTHVFMLRAQFFLVVARLRVLIHFGNSEKPFFSLVEPAFCYKPCYRVFWYLQQVGIDYLPCVVLLPDRIFNIFQFDLCGGRLLSSIVHVLHIIVTQM